MSSTESCSSRVSRSPDTSGSQMAPARLAYLKDQIWHSYAVMYRAAVAHLRQHGCYEELLRHPAACKAQT